MRHGSFRPIAAALLAICSTMAGQPATGASGESAVAASARALATACNEKRFSEAAELLHPSLRRTWIELDYKVRDYCETLTRGSGCRRGSGWNSGWRNLRLVHQPEPALSRRWRSRHDDG